MVKKEALSSDLKFIKEVEELKIKQKLLIESLKRKNSDEQNKLFLEINSKLDFLVNIFNEANKGDDTAEEQENDNKVTSIIEKLDEMNEKINKRFSNIESKLSSTTTDENTKKETSPTENTKKQEAPPIEEPQTTPQKKETKEAPPLETEPPAPDFKSEVENKDDKTKKKKKWF